MTPTIAEDPEWLCVLNYTSLLSFPFALQAAMKLDVFEILSKHGKLSAEQLIHLLPSPVTNPRAALILDRLLLLLSTAAPALPQPLLSASTSADTSSSSSSSGTSSITEYALLPSSKYFLRDENGVCLGEFWVHMAFNMLDSYKHLDVVIREGGDGFQRAHGHQVSHHVAEHAGVQAPVMASITKLFMAKFLEAYDGFGHVGSVVDVGGSSGTALNLILDKYPQLMGINLDQPHIVAAGVAHPRLKHVGGNMLESIPSADAAFIKAILHDWEDDDCVKILTNCRNALTSEHGKVVVVDICVASARGGMLPVHQWDVMMLASHGGKIRTLEEYQKLGKLAGFADFKVACVVNELVVLEYLV